MKESIQDLENQLAAVKANISEIDDIMKPYQEKRNTLVDIRNKISEELDSVRVESIMKLTREEQAEYFINSPNSGSATYREWTKFINKTSLGTFGYNPDTNQYCLQIAMHQDKSNLDATHDDLMFFLPMLKPNSDGLIKISIMEETLCESDTYWLIYDIKSLMWMFTSGRRSKYNQDPVTKHKDLKSVLSFICATAYYIPIDED